MTAGDTYSFVNTYVDQHLWVIISDPAIDSERVLVVNLTSAGKFKEDVCIINRGEHPKVEHKTCVAYKHARIVSLEWLIEQHKDGKIRLHESIPEDVLVRIRQGATLSRNIKLECLGLLEDQGLN